MSSRNVADEGSVRSRVPSGSRAFPVVALVRALPAAKPYKISAPDRLPSRAVISDAALGSDGCAVCGAYVGDGPIIEQSSGRFLGPCAPEGLKPPGRGPLRDQHDFLDRIVWRCLRESRFLGAFWDPASFFVSLAYTFRNKGTWAVIFTDPSPAGGRWIDYNRSPIVLEPRANGRIEARFGPRRSADPRDFVANGRQFGGHLISLRDAVSSLSGRRIDDLPTACRLFDISPPPEIATPGNVYERVLALRELYRAARTEAELWP